MFRPGDPACHNCSVSGSSCLFAPRVKPGRSPTVRPQRTDPQAPPSCEPRNNQPLTPPSYEPSETFSKRARSESQQELQFPEPLITTPALDGSFFDINMSLEEVWNSDATTLLQELNEADFGFDTRLPVREIGPRNHGRPVNIPAGTLLTPSRANTPVEFDFQAIPDEKLNFDTILKVCSDLQDHCRTMKVPKDSPKDMQAIFGSLNSACMTAATAMVSPSTSDGASMALLHTTLCKVVELCDGIVNSILSAQPAQQEHHAINCLLFLKRVDLILLQSKILLIRIDQPEAAKKADHVHSCIDNSLKQQWQPWMW